MLGWIGQSITKVRVNDFKPHFGLYNLFRLISTFLITKKEMVLSCPTIIVCTFLNLVWRKGLLSLEYAFFFLNFFLRYKNLFVMHKNFAFFWLPCIISFVKNKKGSIYCTLYCILYGVYFILYTLYCILIYKTI